MPKVFTTRASIGPQGRMELTALPFNEGAVVRVVVDVEEGAAAGGGGFCFGLHEGQMEMTEDFNEPLPNGFWLGSE